MLLLIIYHWRNTHHGNHKLFGIKVTEYMETSNLIYKVFFFLYVIYFYIFSSWKTPILEICESYKMINLMWFSFPISYFPRDQSTLISIVSCPRKIIASLLMRSVQWFILRLFSKPLILFLLKYKGMFFICLGEEISDRWAEPIKRFCVPTEVSCVCFCH